MNDTKTTPIERVKEKLLLKKQNYQDSLSIEDREKIDFIEGMLHNERCFFEIPRSISIEILAFLDFPDEEIFELYDKLTDYKLFTGNFSFEETNTLNN